LVDERPFGPPTGGPHREQNHSFCDFARPVVN
jgi:hypothetical protein